jgi:hypothetical protein
MDDVTGDDFAGIFASAVGGNHRSSPLGVADVELNGCAWSIKTVKSSTPFTQRVVRLISGRNSPVFSQHINNPLANVQITGNAILKIWNARVDEALAEYDDLRVFVMLRNLKTRQFLVTEHAAILYQPRDYVWTLNNNENLVGLHRDTGVHQFTWQPHGSQFTVHHHIPASAQGFKIVRLPAVLSEQELMTAIGFDDSWIETVEL